MRPGPKRKSVQPQPRAWISRPTRLPGIEVNTGPPNFAPIERLKVMRFKGGEWDFFGDIIRPRPGGLAATIMTCRPACAGTPPCLLRQLLLHEKRERLLDGAAQMLAIDVVVGIA
jgi:hypothetical protein